MMDDKWCYIVSADIVRNNVQHPPHPCIVVLIGAVKRRKGIKDDDIDSHLRNLVSDCVSKRGRIAMFVDKRA